MHRSLTLLAVELNIQNGILYLNLWLEMGYHFENKILVIIAISGAISWFYQGSNFSDISCCSLIFFFCRLYAQE